MSNQPPRRFEFRRGALKSLLPEVREAIKASAEQGLTVRETAKNLDLEYTTVWKAAKDMGVKFRKDPSVGKTFKSRAALLTTTRRSAPGDVNYAGIKAALRW